MTHEWKIGDWFQWANNRYLVVDAYETAGAKRIDALSKGKNLIPRLAVSADFVYLRECDSWDWQPPKPIEPPEGYRLIQEGVVVGGDLCFTAGWRDSERVGDCIEYLIKNGFAKAYARKIEQQYRPMTRAEFLAAWKQRNFCPLIDDEDDIDIVNQVTESDPDYDDETVSTYKHGWVSLDTLSAFKFASDQTFLRVEA